MLRLDRYHVRVIEEDQRLVVAIAFQIGDEVGPARRRYQLARLDALCSQQLGQEVGGELLVAGRVRRIDADVALQRIDGLGRHVVPVDLRHDDYASTGRPMASRYARVTSGGWP